MREYRFFVYIMSSKSRVIYVGLTNDLRVRVFEHKCGRCEGFTKRYRIHRLVYFEVHRYVYNAIAREKELKRWTRDRRVKLIESTNPTWEDIASDWFTAGELAGNAVTTINYKSCSVRAFTSGGEGEVNLKRCDPTAQAPPRIRKRQAAGFKP